jgi:TusA-related sulfurtransferase
MTSDQAGSLRPVAGIAASAPAEVQDVAKIPDSPVPRGFPQAFVDAGDVPWPELQPLLVRQMAALPAGDVLELQSGDPETLSALPTWCSEEGYTLIHTAPGDGYVSHWLGK